MEQQTQEAQSNVGSYDDFKASLNTRGGISPPQRTPEHQEEAPEPKGDEPQPEQATEQPQTEEATQEPQAEERSEPEAPDAGEMKSEGEGGGDEPTKENAIFEILNERLSTEFKDDEELKDAFEQAKRTGELEAKLKEYEEKLSTLESDLDPMKYFASEDDFKTQMFKKEFPDKDASVAYRLFSTDLSEVSDRDIIAYNLMLDNPNLEGGLNGALAIVDDKFGLEEDSELDSITKNKMMIEANSARSNINTVKSGIKLPEKVDLDSMAQQRRESLETQKTNLSKGWNDIASEAVKSIDDIVITDTVDGNETEAFRFSLAKDFPKEEVETVVQRMVDSGVEINKENTSAMMQILRERAIAKNIDKITRAAREDALSRSEKDRLEKQHNPSKPASEPQPEPDKSKADQDRLRSDIGKLGFQPRKVFG